MTSGVPVTVSTLDGACRIKVVTTLTGPGLPVRPADGEKPRGRSGIADVAVAPDGALLLGDLAGPPRSVVAVYRWQGGRAAQRFVLRYPDGSHEAEALLLSYSGQVVVVTTAGGVYVTPYPLRAESVLAKAADLDLPVTGGAVAPAGTHFAIRTGTAAYEWETPDGDIVAALRTGTRRTVKLPAGGGLTYASDGRRLLAMGSATLHEVPIVRTQAERPAESSWLPVGLGAGAVVLLGAGVAVLSRQRRRAARTVTTYQS